LSGTGPIAETLLWQPDTTHTAKRRKRTEGGRRVGDELWGTEKNKMKEGMEGVGGLATSWGNKKKQQKGGWRRGADE